MLHSDDRLDYQLRIRRVQALLQREEIDALVIASNVNLLYTFGHIYSGLAVIPQQGEAQFFIRRPQSLVQGQEGVHAIRKIEQIAELMDTTQLTSVALELDEQTYSDIQRQARLFPNAQIHNATTLLREARMVKSPLEILQTRQGAERHVRAYSYIKDLYRPGMTDRDLQVEIEYRMRRGGSVGLFRCFGTAMEIYMGSLLAGDNAGAPSPYDFALGGAGSLALPLGANGTTLEPGMAVMIDMAGNYGVYYSDLTRTYSIGRLPDEAYRLHELSRRLHREVMQQARPGTTCASLYTDTLAIVEAEGAKPYFMGTEQQAQFVGHGLGLQINEMPVLMGRSRDVLEEGMVIAFEPKFVLPGVGAVGIENTYLVTATGVECLTPAPEEIIDLTKS